MGASRPPAALTMGTRWGTRMQKLNHWPQCRPKPNQPALRAQRVCASAAVLISAMLVSCTKNTAKNADELVRDGWRYFRLEEFDQAQNAFQAAIEQLSHNPNTPLRVNALYGMGMIASVGHHGDQSAQARTYLEQA